MTVFINQNWLRTLVSVEDSCCASISVYSLVLKLLYNFSMSRRPGKVFRAAVNGSADDIKSIVRELIDQKEATGK